MLVVKLWCLPKFEEPKLRELHERLVSAAAKVKEFEVKDESNVINLFPVDAMSYGLGSEVLIEVIELPYHPMQSLASFEALLDGFAEAVQYFVPKARIHAFVYHTHKTVTRNFAPVEIG